MKKIVFFVFIFSLLGVAFFYFYNKRINTSDSKKVIYNPITQKWEEFAKADPLGEDREIISNNTNNTDGVYNKSVLKGYFGKYNETDQVLTLKSVVSFTQNNLFENLDLKLLPSQTIYCAPSIYTDPNTGKYYSIEKLVVPVKDGANLWIPTERIISFDEFLTKSNDRTFIYLQLTENYNGQVNNYIKKLIVIGLCE